MISVNRKECELLYLGFYFSISECGAKNLNIKIRTQLLYQQPELFDNCHQAFDEKLATYKIKNKFYIIINQGKEVLSDKNYERNN